MFFLCGKENVSSLIERKQEGEGVQFNDERESVEWIVKGIYSTTFTH